MRRVFWRPWSLATGAALVVANLVTDALFGEVTTDSVVNAFRSGGVVAIGLLVVLPLVGDRPAGRAVLLWALAIAAVAVPVWVVGVEVLLRGSERLASAAGYAGLAVAVLWAVAMVSWRRTQRRGARHRELPDGFVAAD